MKERTLDNIILPIMILWYIVIIILLPVFVSGFNESHYCETYLNINTSTTDGYLYCIDFFDYITVNQTIYYNVTINHSHYFNTTLNFTENFTEYSIINTTINQTFDEDFIIHRREWDDFSQNVSGNYRYCLDRISYFNSQFNSSYAFLELRYAHEEKMAELGVVNTTVDFGDQLGQFVTRDQMINYVNSQLTRDDSNKPDVQLNYVMIGVAVIVLGFIGYNKWKNSKLGQQSEAFERTEPSTVRRGGWSGQEGSSHKQGTGEENK